MKKDVFLKARLSSEDMLDLSRRARALGMSKSEFARLLLTGGATPDPRRATPAQQPAEIVDSRLDAIDARLHEIDGALSASARAFDQLLSSLNEILRVPSFTEYRARLHAEGVDKQPGESDEQFLLRCATRYFHAFGIWPDPSNPRAFGRVPEGFDPARFLKSRPAR